MNENFRENLPIRCRTWRRLNNLTQKEVARVARVSQSCICKFENGDIWSVTAVKGYMELGMPLDSKLLVNYIWRD